MCVKKTVQEGIIEIFHIIAVPKVSSRFTADLMMKVHPRATFGRRFEIRDPKRCRLRTLRSFSVVAPGPETVTINITGRADQPADSTCAAASTLNDEADAFEEDSEGLTGPKINKIEVETSRSMKPADEWTACGTIVKKNMQIKMSRPNLTPRRVAKCNCLN
ncbi:hypothetical protein GUITHDRAFT_119784 [Guillardia theta CCMP2712]|uniref:Uncharacterized protein n=1 Tax=Guillardia theta (strain CCMP2712) TaxID=905079 RepID=L1ICS9_GUITC|nr:hypothetical protein GUITHDRAFT_119784 [Guillardia theta CCMP2712]EKX34043.1 hypothetical protein GUITHDRAFT_119784 [Guillardia theta CCMP2712]|eukprot:XP_005821023.1 hypothetical protein GUITHDRAFT_119784 [Guillardia theta CCMP2712]